MLDIRIPQLTKLCLIFCSTGFVLSACSGQSDLRAPKAARSLDVVLTEELSAWPPVRILQEEAEPLPIIQEVEIVETEQVVNDLNDTPNPTMAVREKVIPTEIVVEEDFAAIIPLVPTGPLQISLFAHPSQMDKANQLAVVIDSFQRKRLEEKLGRSVEIIFITQIDEPDERKSSIQYSKGNIKAALALASVIPGEQLIEPLPDSDQKGHQDIKVYVGRN